MTNASRLPVSESQSRSRDVLTLLATRNLYFRDYTSANKLPVRYTFVPPHFQNWRGRAPVGYMAPAPMAMATGDSDVSLVYIKRISVNKPVSVIDVDEQRHIGLERPFSSMQHF